MLTSRGATRLSRRAVNSAKRTNALFSTSASPILARPGLSTSAGTQSSPRPARFASSTPGMFNSRPVYDILLHYPISRPFFSLPKLPG